MSSVTWSTWQPLQPALSLRAEDLREILDGGQAFRWNWETMEDCWNGVIGRHAVQLRTDGLYRVEFRSASPERAANNALGRYLAMGQSRDALIDLLPWRSDPVLSVAIRSCPRLFLLRQDFGEVLLGFICSSTKQIVQIKQICEKLAAAFGDEIAPGIHTLPTWEQLARVTEADLRRCALGFRARYVFETAQHLAANPGWLERVPALPYAEAKAALLELPGVGEKVADCVLLFGAAKLEAFPVDVWILRTLETRYGLDGWSPSQVAQFGRAHFGPLAGFAQQFLFAFERQQAKPREGTAGENA